MSNTMVDEPMDGDIGTPIRHIELEPIRTIPAEPVTIPDRELVPA